MKSVCMWGTSLKKVADEAQAIAVGTILRSHAPTARITMFSTDAERLMHGQPEITAISTYNLPRIIGALARADLFLMVGGPFFEAPKQTAACLFLFAVAKLWRCPVVVYGATVFPYTTRWGRFVYRALFNRMERVSVREPVAVRILADLGVATEVSLFSDPRFILRPAAPSAVHALLAREGIRTDQPLIGITTRYLHSGVPAWVKRSHDYSAEHVERATVALARAVAEVATLGQVVIIPMHTDYTEDVAFAQALQQRLPDPSLLKVLSRGCSVAELLGIIAQCDVLIAERLGSAVFATVTGTPLVAIAFEPRMSDYLQRIGLPDLVFDWRELDGHRLAAKVREVWQSRESIRAHMRVQARALSEMAWRNADVVKQFV